MKRRDVLKALATGAVVAAIPKGVEAQEKAKEPQPPRCKVCGKTQEEEQLVCFINPFRPNEAAEMAWCCRHGHFQARVTDPFTGTPIYMTGTGWAIPTLELFHEDWEKYNAAALREQEQEQENNGFYEGYYEDRKNDAATAAALGGQKYCARRNLSTRPQRTAQWYKEEVERGGEL